MLGSKCFGHHYAHHQELTTIALVTTWPSGSRVALGWKLSAGGMDECPDRKLRSGHSSILHNGARNMLSLTYLLTPWCRVILEKLTGLQLVKKFTAFHGTRRFITALTSVRHLSLSWASPIQSIYPHPTSWRSVLILSTHLRLRFPSGLIPSGFLTKTLYTPLSLPIRATCPAHLILLDFITGIISVINRAKWTLFLNRFIFVSKSCFK